MKTSGDDEQSRTFGLRQHAWDYFQYHASQRTTIFNFYLVVCALLATGYFRIVAASTTSGLGIVLGLLFPLLSFVFWRLDQRNAGMVRIAEEALIALENKLALSDEGQVTIVRVFSVEARQTDEAKEKTVFWSWKNYYGHRECFSLIFACNSALGLVASLYALSLVGR